MNGTWIVTAAGTIIAGERVFPNGADALIANAAAVQAGSYGPVGRALSPAGSEGYVIVNIYG